MQKTIDPELRKIEAAILERTAYISTAITRVREDILGVEEHLDQLKYQSKMENASILIVLWIIVLIFSHVFLNVFFIVISWIFILSNMWIAGRCINILGSSREYYKKIYKK